MWIIGGTKLNGLGQSEALSDVWSSSDGITWSRKTADAGFTPRSEHKVVSFQNKLWVVGGKYNPTGGGVNTILQDVWSSVDGITWIEETAAAAFAKRALHTVLVYNNSLWVIGGGDTMSEVWVSSNGKDWSIASTKNDTSFPGREWHESVVFNNKMWLIGGTYYGWKKDVWASE